MDVRVIASSNKDLQTLVRKGGFREDLYFRLSVLHLALPPLRNRLEDLPALCQAIISDLNSRHETQITTIEPAAFEEVLTRVLDRLEMEAFRQDAQRLVIQRGDDARKRRHSPDPAQAAATGPPAVAAPDDQPQTFLLDESPVTGPATQALELDLDIFPAMRHITLHWRGDHEYRHDERVEEEQRKLQLVEQGRVVGQCRIGWNERWWKPMQLLRILEARRDHPYERSGYQH